VVTGGSSKNTKYKLKATAISTITLSIITVAFSLYSFSLKTPTQNAGTFSQGKELKAAAHRECARFSDAALRKIYKLCVGVFGLNDYK